MKSDYYNKLFQLCLDLKDEIPDKTKDLIFPLFRMEDQSVLLLHREYHRECRYVEI